MLAQADHRRAVADRTERRLGLVKKASLRYSQQSLP
jgi:hypothetical protein